MCIYLLKAVEISTFANLQIAEGGVWPMGKRKDFKFGEFTIQTYHTPGQGWRARVVLEGRTLTEIKVKGGRDAACQKAEQYIMTIKTTKQTRGAA